MKCRTISIILILMSMSLPIMAQDSGPVSSVLQVFKITEDAEGNEVVTETTEVKPGDLLEYRITYTNNDAGPITDLRPMLPVPTGMAYVKGSAQPALESASLTTAGGEFLPIPITRQVRKPDGTLTNEEVPAREYRRLRWLVESLEVGESVILVARVTVNDN